MFLRKTVLKIFSQSREANLSAAKLFLPSSSSSSPTTTPELARSLALSLSLSLSLACGDFAHFFLILPFSLWDSLLSSLSVFLSFFLPYSNFFFPHSLLSFFSFLGFPFCLSSLKFSLLSFFLADSPRFSQRWAVTRNDPQMSRGSPNFKVPVRKYNRGSQKLKNRFCYVIYAM